MIRALTNESGTFVGDDVETGGVAAETKRVAVHVGTRDGRAAAGTRARAACAWLENLDLPGLARYAGQQRCCGCEEVKRFDVEHDPGLVENGLSADSLCSELTLDESTATLCYSCGVFNVARNMGTYACNIFPELLWELRSVSTGFRVIQLYRTGARFFVFFNRTLSRKFVVSRAIRQCQTTARFRDGSIRFFLRAPGAPVIDAVSSTQKMDRVFVTGPRFNPTGSMSAVLEHRRLGLGVSG
ncbi:hypothetical protein DFH06DRAFT_1142261 [Mycena polygramma]|nr:hypothetical protein DFH06DRAFT_1142261 [Mycena polygramma]